MNHSMVPLYNCRLDHSREEVSVMEKEVKEDRITLRHQNWHGSSVQVAEVIDGTKPGKVYLYRWMQSPLTVDIVILSKDKSKVLLIQRAADPFKDHWAICGGFVDIEDGESPQHAAYRELAEETGIHKEKLQGMLLEIGAFAGPDRDPRGYTCTIAYATSVDESLVQPVAGDDAQKVQWFPLSELPELAFDHGKIMSVVQSKLKLIQ